MTCLIKPTHHAPLTTLLSREVSERGLMGRGLLAGGMTLSALALLTGLSLGRAPLSLSALLEALIGGPWGEGQHSLIVWWVRLPQTVTALLAGAGLGASGAALQSLFRNPLADPYLLGVSSGGGLGAALAFTTGLITTVGLWALPASSFVGALLSCGLIYAWAWRSRGVSLEQLILIGVALNLLLSALLTLTLSLSEEQLGGVWRWLLGRVDGLAWSEVAWLAVASLTGSGLLCHIRRALWLFEAGEEVAWSLGVEVEQVKRRALWATALTVGGVVAFCGVIGFVGLMAPHFVRPRLSGVSAGLIPYSALYGGGGLALCESLGRLSPSPVPLGVITGCLGGATFLWVVSRRQRALRL